MSAGTEPLDDTFGYGLAADRPAAGIPGRVYYSSDDEVLERDNGTSWDPVASGGSLEVAEEDDDPDVSSVSEVEFVFAGGVAVPRYTACLAQRTSSQSISVNPTKIIYDAADLYDPDGWHDPGGANPTRLTCPSGLGGRVFWVGGSVGYNNAGGPPYLRILKNNTDVVGQTPITSFVHLFSMPVYLADGDYLETLISNATGNSVYVTDVPCTFGVMG